MNYDEYEAEESDNDPNCKASASRIENRVPMKAYELQRVITNFGKGTIITVADGYLFVELDEPFRELGVWQKRKMFNQHVCIDACQCWGPDCEIKIPEEQYCCNADDCGCKGMPIDAPFCSDPCSDKWAEEQRKLKGIVDLESDENQLLF